MRSRTWREGSIGLFIIVGVALFGTLAAWLRGVNLNRDRYTLTITFENSNGMVVGGAVRYRGVKVGTIARIQPTSNGIDAEVTISPATLLIPKNVTIEANQAGLISETAIDLNPITDLANVDELDPPLSRKCDRAVIVCDGDRLRGETGISINAAMSSTINLSDRFTDPEFFGNIISLTENASATAEEVGKLSQELTLLSKSVRGEIRSVSSTARNVTAITSTSARQLNNTAAAYQQTAQQLNNTAAAYQQTAVDLSDLTRNLNALVNQNSANIGSTLSTINTTSNNLSQLVATLNQTLDPAQAQQLIANLEQLSANANTALDKLSTDAAATLDTLGTGAAATIEQLNAVGNNAVAVSENLKAASDAFGDPTTMLTLQQTLQAARATFENAQKITADLDELTGNPEFRRNVRDLVDGLNNLVSSAETLEQQIYLAQELPALQAQALNQQPIAAPEPEELQRIFGNEPKREPDTEAPDVLDAANHENAEELKESKNSDDDGREGLKNDDEEGSDRDLED